MPRKSRIKLLSEPVVSVSRSALRADRFVYVLIVNRLVKYPFGRSSIVYIGTTEKGVSRVASSVAHRAESVLTQFGMKHVHAYLLTYQGRSGVQRMWRKLERAALIVFKQKYGEIPLLNKTGQKIRLKDEFEFFSERALLTKIREFETL